MGSIKRIITIGNFFFKYENRTLGRKKGTNLSKPNDDSTLECYITIATTTQCTVYEADHEY